MYAKGRCPAARLGGPRASPGDMANGEMAAVAVNFAIRPHSRSKSRYNPNEVNNCTIAFDRQPTSGCIIRTKGLTFRAIGSVFGWRPHRAVRLALRKTVTPEGMASIRSPHSSLSAASCPRRRESDRSRFDQKFFRSLLGQSVVLLAHVQAGLATLA